MHRSRRIDGKARRHWLDTEAVLPVMREPGRWDVALRNALVTCTFAAVLGLSACDRTDGDTNPISPRMASGRPEAGIGLQMRQGVTTVTDEERRAGEQLAAALAKAIADPETRAHVFTALASSSVRERKLHLASYVEGRGRSLVRSLAANAGMSGSQLQSVARLLRDLELYVPVAAHRAKWTPDQPILVAIALEEEGSPIAFDAQGKRRVLGATLPPTEAVLVLAPVETDFRQQVAANLQGRAERQCAAETGKTLESTAAACDKHAVASSTLPISASVVASSTEDRGLWATYIRHSHDCSVECWAWGDPEYELHVVSRRTRESTTLSSIQCAGENPTTDDQPGIKSNEYRFDMNGRGWSGRVRLMSGSQLDSVHAIDSGRFAVQLWEDDVVKCRIYSSQNAFFYHLDQTVRSLGWPATAMLLIVASGDSSMTSGYVMAGSWYLAIYNIVVGIGNMFMGGDDFIGEFVQRSMTPWNNELPENTHALVRHGRLIGRGTFVLSGADPAPGTVTTIVTSADTLTLPSGGWLSVGAEGFDAAGLPTGAVAASWVSSDPSVATESGGYVWANAIGQAVLRASYNGAQDSIVVLVQAVGEITSATLTGNVNLVVGMSEWFRAKPLDANGYLVTLVEPVWWTNAPGTASVRPIGASTQPHGASGEVTAVQPGTVELHADFDGAQASLTINVAPAIQVSISGPTSAPSGVWRTWTTSATGGYAPYGYDWYVNNVLRGHGDTFEHCATSTYTLKVIATGLGATSSTGTQSRPITVTGTGACRL